MEDISGDKDFVCEKVIKKMTHVVICIHMIIPNFKLGHLSS